MSLSQRNLSSIQKAGQAVHGASEAIAALVLEQAKSMVARMASEPFGAEAEQAIARFKQLSSLSQGLNAVEAQLQELYALAGDLANPASDVILLPSVAKRKTAASAVAVDVVAKPAKASKKPKNSGRTSVTLTANDAKLLAFLQRKLKTNEALALTGPEMAAGSKLPLGSVGVSLKKIVANGAVKIVGRGEYQLGAAASIPSTPVSKPAPTEKPKVASTKAKLTAVEAPVKKVVKKAKASPAKKLKAAVETPAPSPAAPVAPVEPLAPVEDQAALV